MFLYKCQNKVIKKLVIDFFVILLFLNSRQLCAFSSISTTFAMTSLYLSCFAAFISFAIIKLFNLINLNQLLIN